MAAALGDPLGAEEVDLTERMVALSRPTLTGELTRAAGGLALASVYGLALGARSGGAGLWQHALGVPCGLAAVALVGVPSLFVFLALRDAPLTPASALSATSRALGIGGLLLAGLAPAAALFVITTDDSLVAALSGLFGLLAAGAIALSRFLNDVSRQLRSQQGRVMGHASLAGFALFAALLAIRVWWGLLPIFGGGQ